MTMHISIGKNVFGTWNDLHAIDSLYENWLVVGKKGVNLLGMCEIGGCIMLRDEMILFIF